MDSPNTKYNKLLFAKKIYEKNQLSKKKQKKKTDGVHAKLPKVAKPIFRFSHFQKLCDNSTKLPFFFFIIIIFFLQLIELTELKKILQTNMGPVSDKLVERTFKEIDTDESGSLDFGEVLGVRIFHLHIF